MIYYFIKGNNGEDGDLAEQITESQPTSGDVNYDVINVFYDNSSIWDDTSLDLKLFITYYLEDGTHTAETQMTFSTGIVPEGDYKFFENNKTYKFASQNIPDAVLANEGLVHCVVRLFNGTAYIMSFEDLTFMIKGSHAYDNLVNISEYNYLLRRTTSFVEHIEDKNNPHEVTKIQVGLGNVDNTSDMNKPVSSATQNAINAETQARQNADTALGQRIDAEELARSNADTGLGNRIDAEIVNRGNADTNLQNNINAEAVTRGNEDIALGNRIEAEASVRYSTDSDLQDQINNLKARGRFLSLWNAVTGLATTPPPSLPYTYKSGDYYTVGTVGTTNYKPTGTTYTGVASSSVESETLSVDDVYFFDGTVWHLQINTQKTVRFANIAGQPTDNTNLATALNAKQNALSQAQLNAVNSGIDSTKVAQIQNKADKSEVYTKTETDTLLNGKQNSLTAGFGISIQNDVISVSGFPELETWADIQRVVRAGFARAYFSVGDTIVVSRNNVDIEFLVMGFDQETPVDTTKTHSMTLAMKYTFDGIVFDAREAFFYNGTNAPLPAGTYNFKLGQHNWYSADVGKYIQFTLTKPLPVGGQLVWQQSYNATLIGANIKVFASSSTLDNAPTETVVMSEGQGGTYLGEIKNSYNTTGTYDIYLNHCQRALMGNNRWKDSAIRQWCNSNAVAGSVWTPQNAWDRQPSWYSTKAGFLNGVESGLENVIGQCVKSTEKATVDGGGHETTNDKVWLLSRYEIQSCSQAEAQTYAPYTWWHNLLGDTYGDWRTDTRFIKTNTGGSAQYWWLRSPYTGYGGSARTVYTSGDVTYNSAFFGYQAAVVFAII